MAYGIFNPSIISPVSNNGLEGFIVLESYFSFLNNGTHTFKLPINLADGDFVFFNILNTNSTLGSPINANPGFSEACPDTILGTYRSRALIKFLTPSDSNTNISVTVPTTYVQCRVFAIVYRPVGKYDRDQIFVKNHFFIDQGRPNPGIATLTSGLVPTGFDSCISFFHGRPANNVSSYTLLPSTGGFRYVSPDAGGSNRGYGASFFKKMTEPWVNQSMSISTSSEGARKRIIVYTISFK